MPASWEQVYTWWLRCLYCSAFSPLQGAGSLWHRQTRGCIRWWWALSIATHAGRQTVNILLHVILRFWFGNLQGMPGQISGYCSSFAEQLSCSPVLEKMQAIFPFGADRYADGPCLGLT